MTGSGILLVGCGGIPFDWRIKCANRRAPQRNGNGGLDLIGPITEGRVLINSDVCLAPQNADIGPDIADVR
jgi:hypothetical protein